MKSKLIILGVASIMLFSVIGCAAKTPAVDKNSMSQNHPLTTSGVSSKSTADEMLIKVTSIIDKKFPGEWSVEGNQLKKGSYVENGNFGIADEITANLNGSMASLYLGEVRISNTLSNTKGSRIVAYKIPAEVDKIMKSGKPIDLLVKGPNGVPYQKFYLPIKKGDKTVGVIGISMKVK